MKTLQKLAERWIQEAETLARFKDERGAGILRVCASELLEAARREGEGALTLSEAAQASGYHEDHLRHLISDGKIPNAGRKGSPRIQRSDLPQKPGTRPTGGFDPEAVAAEIVGQIGRGEAA